MMMEMTDILAELDCSLFFPMSRVQPGWWLGVLGSPTGSAGKMQLDLVFKYCDLCMTAMTLFWKVEYIPEKESS